MDITGVPRSVDPIAAPTAITPVPNAPQQREIVHAVKALNATEMFGKENELVFRMDPKAHRMVIRIVNRKTQEVLSQVPPEYILSLHEDLQKGSQEREPNL